MAMGGTHVGYAQPTENVQHIPDMQRMNGNLQVILDKIGGGNSILADFIGRVYGTGEAGEKQQARPQAAGVMGSIDRQLADIDEQLQRMQGLLARINQLA